MDDNDNDWKTAAKAVPQLRFLKTLVTGLAVVMALGMIALVALMWMRLSQPMLPELPDNISLPDDARVGSVTFARDWIVVVTEQADVLLYDRQGKLVDRVRPQSP